MLVCFNHVTSSLTLYQSEDDSNDEEEQAPATIQEPSDNEEMLKKPAAKTVTKAPKVMDHKEKVLASSGAVQASHHGSKGNSHPLP